MAHSGPSESIDLIPTSLRAVPCSICGETCGAHVDRASVEIGGMHGRERRRLFVRVAYSCRCGWQRTAEIDETPVTGPLARK